MLYFFIILDVRWADDGERGKDGEQRGKITWNFFCCYFPKKRLGGCEDEDVSLPPRTDDMTRECLEKREMVFYMFFMCFNTAGEEKKNKHKRNGSKNYGMRLGKARVFLLFFRARRIKNCIQPKKKEKKTKESEERVGVE